MCAFHKVFSFLTAPGFFWACSPQATVLYIVPGCELTGSVYKKRMCKCYKRLRWPSQWFQTDMQTIHCKNSPSISQRACCCKELSASIFNVRFVLDCSRARWYESLYHSNQRQSSASSSCTPIAERLSFSSRCGECRKQSKKPKLKLASCWTTSEATQTCGSSAYVAFALLPRLVVAQYNNKVQWG